MAPHCFKNRFRLIIISFITIALALLFGSLQPSSWAATGQHPNQQTIPPRPTATSVPSATTIPLPSTPLTPDSTNTTGTNDENDESRPEIIPTATAETDENVNSPSENNDGETTQPPPATTSPNESISAESGEGRQNGESQDEGSGNSLARPELVDLSLMMQVDNSQPVVGESITFTLVISNSGPGLATGVAVNASLPTGLAFHAALADKGGYDFRNGMWDIDQIRPQQSLTLTLNTFVAERGTIINKAEVGAVMEADPDSTPNNQVEGEDDQASLTLSARADLSLAVDSSMVTQEEATTVETSTELDNSSVGSQFLFWLFALIMGVILVMVGLVLINRT